MIKLTQYVFFCCRRASAVVKVSSQGGEAGPPRSAAEDAAAMKGVEATPEEQERLATGNNNGSLDCKLRPHQAGARGAFHSTHFFMLIFLSGWVLQGMFLTYFVSVTTTVEKLYKVESKTTGTLLAATEIGQICTALFLTYLAGRGHRPRWIACMMLVLAVGVIGCVLPHVLYGTQLLDVHLDDHKAVAAPVCYTYMNSTVLCDDDHVKSSEARSSITAIVIPWLFVCLLVVGVGQTGIATLGIPYVDDNVGSRQSPLYMGKCILINELRITSKVRLVFYKIRFDCIFESKVYKSKVRLPRPCRPRGPLLAALRRLAKLPAELQVHKVMHAVSALIAIPPALHTTPAPLPII